MLKAGLYFRFDIAATSDGLSIRVIRAVHDCTQTNKQRVGGGGSEAGGRGRRSERTA